MPARVGRFWLGSVADRLVRESPMPVLLVHPRPQAPDFRENVPLKHIMVPLDGSPFAEKILDPAVNLGRLVDADYTLLRVIKAVFPYPYNVEGASLGEMAQNLMDRIDKVQEDLKREAHAYLESVAQRLRNQGFHVKTLVTVDEKPAAGLVHQAVAPVTDAWPSPRTADTGWPGCFTPAWPMKSFAIAPSRCLSSRPGSRMELCRVRSSRGQFRTVWMESAKRVSTMFKKILLPMDLTAKHGPALHAAAELCRQSAGEVILFHAIETIPGLPLEEEKSFYGRLESSANEHLARLLAECAASKCPVAMKCAGASAEETLRSREQGCDLIILTAPQFREDKPAVGLGSLGWKIGVMASCPVLLVKSAGVSSRSGGELIRLEAPRAFRKLIGRRQRTLRDLHFL